MKTYGTRERESLPSAEPAESFLRTLSLPELLYICTCTLVYIVLAICSSSNTMSLTITHNQLTTPSEIIGVGSSLTFNHNSKLVLLVMVDGER